MKQNKIEHRGRRVWVVVGIVAVTVIVLSLAIGYEKLKSLYQEQGVIADMSEQVSISSGKMVKPDVIAEFFGLRVGANVLNIDFAEKRAEILRKIPTLRSVSVVIHRPNRVIIRAEERTPVVKLNTVGGRGITGRVADAEGMVFYCQRGTQMLPTIRESRQPPTPAGHELKGRARAALDLVTTSREVEFSELGLLEVDTSKTDFLVATLGDYTRVKICWEGMDDATPAAHADLVARLGNLIKVIRNKGSLRAVIWNATLPDYIFVDTQEKL